MHSLSRIVLVFTLQISFLVYILKADVTFQNVFWGDRRGVGGAHIYHCWYVRIHTKKFISMDRASLIHILM